MMNAASGCMWIFESMYYHANCWNNTTTYHMTKMPGPTDTNGYFVFRHNPTAMNMLMADGHVTTKTSKEMLAIGYRGTAVGNTFWYGCPTTGSYGE